MKRAVWSLLLVAYYAVLAQFAAWWVPADVTRLEYFVMLYAYASIVMSWRSEPKEPRGSAGGSVESSPLVDPLPPRRPPSTRGDSQPGR